MLHTDGKYPIKILNIIKHAPNSFRTTLKEIYTITDLPKVVSPEHAPSTKIIKMLNTHSLLTKRKPINL